MQFPGVGTYTINAYGSELPNGVATSTAESIVTVGFVTTPMVSAVTTDTILCTGNSAILTASGAATYTWNTSANTSTISISPSTNTTYTVSGKNGFCTSSFTITQVVDPCTSLFEATKFETSAIFPNPFSDELHFSSNGEMEICIKNIVGDIVKRSVFLHKGSVDTSELPRGIYYVSLKTEKETKVFKTIRN
jgi:hypothetical protein